jgi:Bacterial regulatory helix-turn-helix protein, lysR family
VSLDGGTRPRPIAHLANLDLNLLVALRGLLRERSVTRAAERLGVTQPAASAAQVTHVASPHETASRPVRCGGQPSAFPRRALDGQEESGQADEDEHPDHAREDQDDNRPGLHDTGSLRGVRSGALPLSAASLQPR